MYDVSFCVPTTSRNRDWISSTDSYLHAILLRSLDQRFPNARITVYCGYDEDDKIFSQADERLKLNAIYTKFNIVWISYESDPGNVVKIWNSLAKTAVKDGFEYIMILGDDIKLPNDTAWLNLFIKNLKKQNNIGYSAGWSNNNDIATQFLIHKTHLDIFDFVFPPQIKNWFCDNWMNEIYPKKLKYWRKDYPLLNVGGEPRYLPLNDRKLCDMLVRRYKPNLSGYLNSLNK